MSEHVFIKSMISQIRSSYGDILEADMPLYLQDLERQITKSYDRFRAGSRQDWGITIPQDYPLRFIESERPRKTRIDIYCDIRWTNSVEPDCQDIKLRVWSYDESIIWDKAVDSDEIYLKMVANGTDLKRVVSRYHFDRANHNQGKGIEYHPEYHVQIGGKSEEYELCWHPKSYDIPRLVHHPMDLFLTFQLAAINFFPTRYQTGLSLDGSWKITTKSCERRYLESYYRKCLNTVRDKDAVLLNELSS